MSRWKRQGPCMQEMGLEFGLVKYGSMSIVMELVQASIPTIPVYPG